MSKRPVLSLKRNKGIKMSNSTTTVPATQPPEQKVTEVKGVQAEDLQAASTSSTELVADPLLLKILATKRAHTSRGDSDFRIWLFQYIKSMKLEPQVKEEGCILVETDSKSTVLFSCHVDTVHSIAESDGSKQELAFDPMFGHIFLAEKSKSTCLGGDDGVGIYIMLQMLKAGVKGRYIFHTGEERGGIGAKAFVRANAKYLDDIEMVVAIDRPTYEGENPEVIITQGGRPCASNAFGDALALELNKFPFDMPYVVSTKGVYTDSKEYASLVPECINLGCFYNRQHTSQEYVDIVGVEVLLQAMKAIDWMMLPIIRKPSSYGAQQPYTQSPFPFHSSTVVGDPPKFKSDSIKKAPDFDPLDPLEIDDLEGMSMYDIEQIVEDEVDQVSKLIAKLYIRVRTLENENELIRTLAGL